MRSLVYVDTRTMLDVYADDRTPNTYWISRINVPSAFRGQGHGRAALADACAMADAEGVTLRLFAVPSGGLDFRGLISWYERNGFTHGDEIGDMTRKPQ